MTFERLPVVYRLPQAPLGICRTCGHPLQYEREAFRGCHRGLYCEGWLDGLDEMARVFWASVCETLAKKADAEAAKAQASARWKFRDAMKNDPMGYVYQDPYDLFVEGVMCRNQVACANAYQAARDAADVGRQLRADLRTAGITRPELFGGATGDDATQRPITFHDLRHTYATWLALRGEPVMVIQQRLGHTDAKMTARYIEAAEEVGRGAIGTPFPELPTGVLSKSFVHEKKKLVDTTVNLARPRGFEPVGARHFGHKPQRPSRGELEIRRANPSFPGHLDTWLGRMGAAVEILRLVRDDERGDRDEKLNRYRRAANDVCRAWDRRAA